MSKKVKNTLSAIAFSAILVGCGGGGTTSTSNDNNGKDSSNVPKTSKFNSAKVADGYIAGANVLVDINTTHKGFSVVDSGDFSGKTNSNGDFNISNTLDLKVGTYVYAKGGIIVSTGETFDGTLKAVFSGDKKEIVITPLTTMVAHALGAKPNKDSINKAKEKVAKALGIKTKSVEADPVKDEEAFKATQKVVAIAKVIKEANGGNKKVTDILEEVAKEISKGKDLNKTVEVIAPSKNVASIAKETADKVEDAIETLRDKHNIKDSFTIETIVTDEIVDKVSKSVKKDINNTKHILSNIKIDNLADIAKASKCLTFEKIKGKNSISTAVTANLNLDGIHDCEKNGVKIDWINSSKDINLTTGAVIRATYEDKIAFVEANISKENKSLIKPIFMTIKALGHKPILKDDSVYVNVDTNVTIDVLANDFDADGRGDLKLTSITKPKHGVAVINHSKVDYSPNSGFTGEDSFTYTVKDPLGAEVNATVNIKVKKSALGSAIKQIENFDKDNGDFQTLLSSVKSTLEKADKNEKDAQIGLALVGLAETLDNDLSNLIVVGNQEGSIDAILNKKDGVKIALAAIDNLSETTEDTLEGISQKLLEVAKKIDELLAKEPNYVFGYKNITLNADDLKALSGAIELKVALLEYAAAYNIAKKEYLETKEAKINGKTVEYQLIKVDPKTVLNDKTTLSLNSNAQSHFDKSKDALQNAINKLTKVKTANVNEKFRKKLADLQKELIAINKSLNAKGDYIVVSKHKNLKYHINVAALFNENTAPTLSKVLGNNWGYHSHSMDYISTEDKVSYNQNLSILHNKPIVSIYDKEHNVTFQDDIVHIRPIKIPLKTNVLPNIITKIEEGKKVYTKEGVLHKLFGEFKIVDNKWRYNSLNDVNISYTIKNGPTGYTGPYSCKIKNPELYNYNWENIKIDGDWIKVSTNGNSCKVDIVESAIGISSGIISFELTVNDKYGHKDTVYGYFEFGNRENTYSGGSESSQNSNSDNGLDNNENANDSTQNSNSQNDIDIYKEQITADDYNNAKPIDIPQDILYNIISLDNQHQESQIEEYSFVDGVLYSKEYINGKLAEEEKTTYANVNNEIQIQEDDELIKVKFVKVLNNQELNQYYKNQIFKDGDLGYLIYIYAYSKYRAKIFLNQEAYNSLMQYLENGN